MASAFTDYSATGPADPRRARIAASIDLGVGAFLALLVWPFPVMRLVLTDATGSVALGWVAHVALLLASMVVADAVYGAVFILTLKRTVGMYLQDLGMAEGAMHGTGAAALAALWALAGVAGVLGVLSPAARVAERHLVSTRMDA